MNDPLIVQPAQHVLPKSNLRPTTKTLALTAVLAAAYTVGRAIPISRFLGPLAGVITAAGIIAPIMGILLDPAYAIAAVTIGTYAGAIFPWNRFPFFGLDFLPGIANVATISLLVRGRRLQAITISLVVIVLFLVTPNTRFFVGSQLYSPPIPYLWMHFIALLTLVSPLTLRLSQKLSSTEQKSVLTSIVIIAFVGTMLEHATGGILYALFVGPAAIPIWKFIFLAYPVERGLLVLGATLLGTPIILALNTMRMKLQEAGGRTTSDFTVNN